MPRPALITLDHIREAIKILDARGQSATNRSIRDIVGFGSFDTIGKLRKQLETVVASQAENLVELESDNSAHESAQRAQDYCELWHEAASDCDALRNELATAIRSNQRYTTTNLPLRKLKEVYKLYFDRKTDRQIAKEAGVPLSVVEYVLLR